MAKTDGTVLNEWRHVVPVRSDEVCDFGANDVHGSLQTTINSRNNRATDIHTVFRNQTETPSRRTFTFDYKAPISPLVLSGIWSETIVYFDSFYHNNMCKDLTLEITLPKGAQLMKSIPPIDQKTNPFKYHLGEMQALDDITFHLAFKVHKIGKQFWIWLGTVIAAAIIGVVIRKLIG